MIIIDESGAANINSTLIPLSKYKIDKLVLCGDHKQLPPCVKFDVLKINKELHYDRSLFENLIDRFKFNMLCEQYRMEKSISSFISKFF